jgi:hypothetical protein
MDMSRFNGLRFERHHVGPFILSLLDSLDLGGTLNREKILNKSAAAGLSAYLGEYVEKQGVYMKINYVNPDHVHALIASDCVLNREINAAPKGKFFSLD